MAINQTLSLYLIAALGIVAVSIFAHLIESLLKRRRQRLCRRKNGKGKRRQISGDVIAYFAGILRRGPYLPPQNYKSPEVERREAYLEWKRREAEQLRWLDREVAEVAFHEWWGRLSEEEKKSYGPDQVGAAGEPIGSAIHLDCVKQRYIESHRSILEEQIKAAQAEQKADQANHPVQS